jgi:hypothetical protein
MKANMPRGVWSGSAGKKYIIIALILFLSAACSKQPAVLPVATSTPVSLGNQTPGLQLYKNKNYNFELNYPQNFSFETPTYGALSDQVVSLTPDSNLYPGTNYDDSAITVSAGFAKDASQCLVNSNDNKPLTQTQTINGQVFYVGRATGAAAGNLYSSTIYRTLRQNRCTEISLTIHTGNIANYPNGTVIEVDQSKPMADLLQILSTFKFTN